MMDFDLGIPDGQVDPSDPGGSAKTLVAATAGVALTAIVVGVGLTAGQSAQDKLSELTGIEGQDAVPQVEF